METLLAFAPFIVYVVIERLAGIMPGLVSAAVVSVGLLLRDAISPGRTVKILEVGTVILFGGLAVYARFAAVTWSIAAVRLRVDAGLLAIVVASIVVRRPFTLQYARERVSREFWDSPEFVRTNYIITAAWAGAFAAMVAADLAMLYVPALPRWVSIAATVAALYGAFSFTDWYPKRNQEKAPHPESMNRHIRDFKKQGARMKKDAITHFLLLVIAIALIAIAVRPYLAPEAVQAQSGSPYPFYIEPGTQMLRAPDGSQQVYGRVVVDMRTGKVWGFPTFTSDTYPVNGTDSKPRTSHPFVLAKFAFDDTEK